MLPPRKNPVKRAFSGLVGLPPETEPQQIPPQEPAVVPAEPKRRGRPPKGERTMTATERKQSQRAGEKIGEVLAIPDSRGRLHNERSGEADRRFGMGEMERIVAAQERDEECGRRIGPGGRGSDKFEKDDDSTEPVYNSPRSSIPAWYVAAGEEMDVVMVRLVAKFYTGNRCQLCGVSWLDDPLQHFWNEYEQGLKLYRHYKMLSEPEMAEVTPSFLIEEARQKYRLCKHLMRVWSWLESYREEKKEKSNFVTSENDQGNQT
jgi:hypothetical protein